MTQGMELNFGYGGADLDSLVEGYIPVHDIDLNRGGLPVPALDFIGYLLRGSVPSGRNHQYRALGHDVVRITTANTLPGAGDDNNTIFETRIAYGLLYFEIAVIDFTDF